MTDENVPRFTKLFLLRCTRVMRFATIRVLRETQSNAVWGISIRFSMYSVVTKARSQVVFSSALKRTASTWAPI